MDAFDDFLDLRTAVVEAIKRPDLVEVMHRIVALAEGRINRSLRMSGQLVEETLTVEDGKAALPDDFEALYGLYRLADGAEYVEQPLSAVLKRSSDGYFAIIGNFLRMVEAAVTVRLCYFARFPTICNAPTGTNWLLQRYPEVYYYAVCAEAARFVQDTERMPVFEQARDAAFRDARADDQARQFDGARVRFQGARP